MTSGEIIGVVDGGIVAMPSAVAVAHATPADFESIVAMARAKIAESPEHQGRRFDEDRVRRLCRTLHAKAAEGAACLLIARAGNEPIGFLIAGVLEYFFNERKCTSDVATYVRAEHRDGPALAELVAAFEQWAAAHGVATEGYFTIDASQEKYFQRMGYRRVVWNLTKKLEVPHG